MTDLRARQKALARRTIAEAAGALAAERRHLDFSMQEVADRAEVSLRTVYNHFANREALLDGLMEHIDELFRERGGLLVGDVDRFEQLADGVTVNFPIFEELGAMVGLADTLEGPDTPVSADHDRRTRRIVELVTEAVPDVSPDVAVKLGLLVRHLLSRRTWTALTQDYGLTTPKAIAMARWAMATLVAAARRGEVDELEGSS